MNVRKVGVWSQDCSCLVRTEAGLHTIITIEDKLHAELYFDLL